MNYNSKLEETKLINIKDFSNEGKVSSLYPKIAKNHKEDPLDGKDTIPNIKIQKCKFCANTFKTTADYLSHIEKVHQGDKKRFFMCSVCGKQYKTKSELTHHINSKCGTMKQFKCKVCHQELMSAGSLYNHMLRHNGDRSFMCRYCAKLFFTAGQLKVHERIHTQDKAYICEVCNKGFCHRQSLITHSTLHTGIKPYQCENCGQSFSCIGNLIKHRKTHKDTCALIPLITHRVQYPSTKIKVKINTPANSRLKTMEKDKELQEELSTLKTELENNKTEPQQEIFTQDKTSTLNEADDFENDCEYETGDTNSKLCSKDLTPVDEYIPGDFLSTNDAQNMSENEICDVSRSVKSENDTEITNMENIPKPSNKKKSAYNNIRKFYKKRHCEKNINYEKLILLFMEEQTNFGKEGYGDCKYCGKRYTNVRWLYRHVKDHETKIPKTEPKLEEVLPHKCSCCKLTFHTKEDSLIHQQSEHADLLTCHDCEKLFSNRDSLRSHQKNFHKGLGRKSYLYICEKCGKQFKQKSYLKSHEERNCDKGPFYECSICKKQFSSIHTRNNHMRIHDPEKKLSCKFCSKSFHWKGQLKIHERSHTGEKPFACLYCPKAFAYRESLITHSTIHTGIKPHLCEGCGSRFSCIGNLIKHRSSHASECGAWTYKSQKTVQDNSVN